MTNSPTTTMESASARSPGSASPSASVERLPCHGHRARQVAGTVGRVRQIDLDRHPRCRVRGMRQRFVEACDRAAEALLLPTDPAEEAECLRALVAAADLDEDALEKRTRARADRRRARNAPPPGVSSAGSPGGRRRRSDGPLAPAAPPPCPERRAVARAPPPRRARAPRPRRAATVESARWRARSSGAATRSASRRWSARRFSGAADE